MISNGQRRTVLILMYATMLFIFGCGGGGSSQPTLSTISGKVSLNGAGFAGVTMTIAGVSSGNTATDDVGNYKFTGLPDGNYTITPSISGYTFFPTSQTVTVVNGNIPNME